MPAGAGLGVLYGTGLAGSTAAGFEGFRCGLAWRLQVGLLLIKSAPSPFRRGTVGGCLHHWERPPLSPLLRKEGKLEGLALVKVSSAPLVNLHGTGLTKE